MLKREISKTNLLIASAGGMVGSGWLFSPFISAQIAGSDALWSWVIAALFMWIIALPLCELGTMFPVSGGMSNYPTYTHGKAVGFLFAWTSWLSYVVMTPIEVQAILQYGSHFFPSVLSSDRTTFALSGYGYVIAFVIMLSVVVLNTYGIRRLTECNKYLSFLKFLLPSIAIVSLLINTQDYQNLAWTPLGSVAWKNVFSALSVGGVAFAFTGFQNGLVLAGEVKNPERNIPLSLLGAVLIGFLLYFMLQLSFIVAVPQVYLTHGWQHLNYPGESGPLVGLTLLLGLGWVATLLMIDAIVSPFGTTFVYTAATSRIVYGMALNHHLPAFFLKENRYHIPYVTLYANLIVGLLSFLPFPGWQKLVAFLSSASILSYSVGPICLLAMRRLKPTLPRPFALPFCYFFAHMAFYVCNLMLYWCGFSVIWKLDIALLLGMFMYCSTHRESMASSYRALLWFTSYMIGMLCFSKWGSFGGSGQLSFPMDMVWLLPFSIVFLKLAEYTATDEPFDVSMQN